ncbi:hypothetical protein BU15DRAFT_60423 [Melanogaster broomeanus]|nr:hypothetical protein BU15DRAFT_60423 [Melanogaster broomeanus]
MYLLPTGNSIDVDSTTATYVLLCIVHGDRDDIGDTWTNGLRLEEGAKLVHWQLGFLADLLGDIVPSESVSSRHPIHCQWMGLERHVWRFCLARWPRDGFPGTDALLLYGLTLAQTWYYFRSYPEDSCRTKLLVAFLSLLGTAQVALVSASLYQYTIVWAGDPVMLSHVTTTFESVIAFLVQLTYARRIWRLSFGNVLLTYPIVAVERPISTMGKHAGYQSCDVAIAGSQVYLFHKSRTGIGRLGGLITRLTILVVNVGLLTSIDVTVFLVLFLVCPSNGAFLVPYILMSHCYLNSFLSV